MMAWSNGYYGRLFACAFLGLLLAGQAVSEERVPLEKGIYYEEVVSCESPGKAMPVTWNGTAFSIQNALCTPTNVVRTGNLYHFDETCVGRRTTVQSAETGGGSFSTTLTLTSRTLFTIKRSADGVSYSASYHFCRAK